MTKSLAKSLTIGTLFGIVFATPALAQQAPPPVLAITTPIVNLVDENRVSLISGKVELSLPLLQFGDVAFSPYAVNGKFWQSHIADNNTGHVVSCLSWPNVSGANSYAAYMESGECSAGTANNTIQAVYGQERASFYVSPTTGAWVPEKADGETFTDTNNGYCTWTRRDGTQIVYYAYHQSSGAPCQSQNIYKIIYPDNRVADYYYYGTISNTAGNPILSIATSDGYLLQYNYSGTPTFGGETSVTGINRAFQACSPTVSCSISGWPTATFSWATKPISPPENMPWINNYNGSIHYVLTATSPKQEKHVLELDSIYRVVSYQPPGETQPKYNYRLCSQLPRSGDVYPMQNCFGYESWSLIIDNQVQKNYIDAVEVSFREGMEYDYAKNTALNFGWPSWTRFTSAVYSQAGQKFFVGNQSPNMYDYGPAGGALGGFGKEDGTSYTWSGGVANQLHVVATGSGVATNYTYDAWGNVTSETVTPNQGTGTISRSAIYPGNCTASTLVTCTKPTSVTDGNSKTTSFTYDPTHGGVLTETDSAVGGITPQKRFTYVQRYPWYLNSSGSMTRETRPVWLLNTESHCRTSAPAAGGVGCTAANDEVVITYDYGPDSGPNNLLLRGQTVTSAGAARRTCFGHDKYTNRIWEQAPNANAASCAAY